MSNKAFILPTIFTAVDKFTSKVVGMSKGLDTFVGKAEKAQRKLDKTFTGLGGNFVVGGAVAGLGLATYAVKKFVDEASKIENAEAFFTPVLGSAQKAAKLVGMLNKEAAITPFRFEDLSKVASSLLPLMNGDLNKVISTFRLLGDTSGGSVDKLQRITLGYTKALLKGKVTLESLNIIAEAGVPIFSEMAKAMNLGEGTKGTAKLFKMITAGKVPVEMLTKTFEKMGAKGGLFYKGMITASETFTGITSTLEDNVSMTAASIGKELLSMAKEYALKAIEITGKIREWVGQNKELIASKFKEFLQGAVKFATELYKAAVFIYKNWSTIVFWFKIYIGLLIAMKTASIIIGITTTAMNLLSIAIWTAEAAQWAWGTAQAVSLALQGKTILFLEGNAVAMGIYKVAMALGTAATWVATTAQWAWNAALAANPIVWIIAAIVALIVVMVLIVKYWDEWGAAVNLLFAIFMPGISLIIGLVMSFYNNWQMIVDAFKNKGILGGLLAIGKVLLDVILNPLQQILEVISKVTGFDWAADAAKGVKEFRASLDLNTGDQIEPTNPQAERQQQMNEVVMNRNNNVSLDINTPKGTNANVRSNSGGIPISTGSTHKWGM